MKYIRKYNESFVGDDPFGIKDFKDSKKSKEINDKKINDIFLEIQKLFNISNLEFIKEDEFGHQKFTYKHNKLLEISRNMDDWIDLTWGYKIKINGKLIDCSSSLSRKIFNFFKTQLGTLKFNES